MGSQGSIKQQNISFTIAPANTKVIATVSVINGSTSHTQVFWQKEAHTTGSLLYTPKFKAKL